MVQQNSKKTEQKRTRVLLKGQSRNGCYTCKYVIPVLFDPALLMSSSIGNEKFGAMRLARDVLGAPEVAGLVEATVLGVIKWRILTKERVMYQ